MKLPSYGDSSAARRSALPRQELDSAQSGGLDRLEAAGIEAV